MSQSCSPHNMLTSDSLSALLVAQSKVSSQRLLDMVQLCTFCISQRNSEYAHAAQNSAGSRTATLALQTPTSKIKLCLWEVLHYFGTMLPLLWLYYLWYPYLHQVSRTVGTFYIISCSPWTVFSWVVPHLLVRRRNLGVSHIHKGFLKRNKLSLPAAPEFPFNPGIEESFSSLSGWNVSVLAL